MTQRCGFNDHRRSGAFERLYRWAGALAFMLTLGGCGFQMQGATQLPFETFYIGVPENTQFGADLRRAIRAASPDVVLIEPSEIVLTVRDFGDEEDMDDRALISARRAYRASQAAQARFEIVSLIQNTRQVSLNAQGQVEEFELMLKLTFRIVDSNQQIILGDTTLTAIRSLPFDPRFVQAKETEQATLYKDMYRSLVTRIVRRITAADVTERWNTVRKEEASGTASQDPAPMITPMPQNPSQWRQTPSLTPLPSVLQGSPQ
jgi:LPS-assembly lipoprotein